MPGRDGTGPRGQGMFTGRGEGYCALRLPEPGSDEPAVGYAGIEGRLVQLATGVERLLRGSIAPVDAQAQARLVGGFGMPGRRCRFGRRRSEHHHA